MQVYLPGINMIEQGGVVMLTCVPPGESGDQVTAGASE
jgi:hypothetical protein